MARDIDYAAIAVRTALAEKFGWKEDLQALEVIAKERTISLRHGLRTGEGTRHELLAAARDASSYTELWEILAKRGTVGF
jgi:hypothetical protein